MKKIQFQKLFKELVHPEPVKVRQAAHGHFGGYVHPFVVQALALEGIIETETKSEVQAYKAGDVFHLEYGQLHLKTHGPEGVR